MKNVFIISVLFFTATLSSIAKSKIRGKVSYNVIRPLGNVNVFLEGTYDGTTSNEKGEFNFDTDEVGTFKIVAKLDGFVDVMQTITIKESEDIKIDLVFLDKSLMLSDVIVRPKLFDLNDKNKYTTLNPIDVLTTATDGNVVSAMKIIPGAQQIGESGDLFVRGGTGSETKIYIDGLLVNNFNYGAASNIAARSRFPAGMFKGTFFSTGGYSAQYGQALSSTLILESDDFPNKSSADLTISPIMVGGSINRVNSEKTFSASGTINYTNLGIYNAMAHSAISFISSPQYLDGNISLKNKFKNGGVLKALLMVGSNSMTLDRANLDYDQFTNRISLKNNNYYSNITYKQNIKGGWKWNTGLSYSQNRDLTRVNVLTENGAVLDSSVAVKDASTLLQIRNVFSKMIFNKTRLNLGNEYHFSTESQNNKSYNDNYVANFVETESYLTDNISARIGIRMEYSSIIKRINLAPRLSVGYNFVDNSLLSVSVGKFYQKPERQYLLLTPTLNYTNAEHYIISYQKLDIYRTFRTEVFYKKYDELIKTKPSISNNGDGYAQGFEVFYRDKKTIKGIDYWLSYSFLDTKRNFLYYPYAVTPTFAAKHTTTVTVKKFFNPIQTNVSMTYTFASGRPYFNPSRPDDKFLTDHTISYNNLGLSVSYLPKIKKTFSVCVLTISNMLGNKQIYGYTYSNRDFSKREAIVPPNNPFIFLGFFMNLGIDRRNDIINGQL